MEERSSCHNRTLVFRCLGLHSPHTPSFTHSFTPSLHALSLLADPRRQVRAVIGRLIAAALRNDDQWPIDLVLVRSTHL